MRYATIRWALLVSCCASFVTAAEKPSPEQIRAWRAEGPAAVDRLMAEREKRVAAAIEIPRKGGTFADAVVEETAVGRAAWERVYAINETIDAVAAARYSHESGLYWYTDEAEAKRVAKAQGKPILALRLLGNLNEELSCANSRYFRILLYPDDKVRKLLHDKFILTWKSVRPVPKITIDLGDGRKVERTITGNSVHYVLLPGGQVVDVFPGLYGPVPFCERLVKAHAAALLAMSAKDSEVQLIEYRKRQIAAIEKTWEVDVAKYDELMRKRQTSRVESKLVGQVPSPPPSFWEVAAEFHPEYSDLSKASLALVKQEAKIGESYANDTLRAEESSPDLDFAFAKGDDESALRILLACIQPALQADTLHNEYRGRYIALRRLNRVTASSSTSPFDDDSPVLLSTSSPSLETLNDVLYTEIFHYDPYDPWIGLARLNSLTALPNNRGLIRDARAKE